MKLFLRLISCTLLCVLPSAGVRATLLPDQHDLLPDPSSVILLPKNDNICDRFSKNIRPKEENKKKQQKPVPVKPTLATKPVNKPTKLPSPKPTSWTGRLPIARLLLGCSAGSLAAYLVDKAIFTRDYAAEIALERENLRGYIVKRRDISDKEEYKAEYDKLTECIAKTRRHLTQLKMLKQARALVAPLVFVTTVAVSTILPSAA